jgi:chemotaxis protein MotB
VAPTASPERPTLKKMRGTKFFVTLSVLSIAPQIFGCGYSQEEWDQKVRETEELRNDLDGEKSARAKAEADYADALEEIDALRAKLMESGVNVDSLSANLEAQQKALAEYERRMAHLGEIRARFLELRSKLQKLTALGLKVAVRDNRMVIQLPGDVLFDSGSDKLKEGGKQILLDVARVVRSDDELRKRQFQVAGHTDDRPLKGGRFGDNWGLSAMRARSVLLLLTAPEAEEGGGLPAKNWSAAGYGERDPIATNATEEGREQNRRVELVIQPDVAEMLNLNSLAGSAD